MAGDYTHVRVHTVPQPTAGEPYHFYSLGVATYPCYVFRYFLPFWGKRWRWVGRVWSRTLVAYGGQQQGQGSRPRCDP